MDPTPVLITLTPRQHSVYSFVQDFVRRHGYSPTYREIGRHFAIAPKNARQHILALARKGTLTHAEGTARSIVLGNKNYSGAATADHDIIPIDN